MPTTLHAALHTIVNVWEKTKGAFGFANDARPDPEDPDVYAHAQNILTYERTVKYPTQVFQDGRNKDKVPQPKVKYTYWVDVYTGPEGDGYVINYETQRGNKRYHKSINVGPQPYREEDWFEVVEAKI